MFDGVLFLVGWCCGGLALYGALLLVVCGFCCGMVGVVILVC